MRKIITSLVLITVLTGLTVAATRAFFAETESSNNNTFTAGALDLKIGNQHSVNPGVTDGTINWSLDDIGNKVYFNFGDIKPGDWGENTLTFRIIDNPAWMCAKVTTTDEDNGFTSPEQVLDNDTSHGELGQFLSFIWWIDDGNNILNVGETPLFGGPVTLAQMMGTADNGTGTLKLTLTDSILNNFGTIGDPIPANTPKYLGIGWCLGTITISGTDPKGYVCDGTSVTNVAQTDKVTGSLDFSIEQYRNNTSYLCPEHVTPTAIPTP